MIIIINNLVPVFALMALGHFLGRTDFIADGFFKAADRLVYYIFFPAMLFWKIGGAGPDVSFDLPVNFTALAVVFFCHLISLAYVKAAKMNNFMVGSFSQCSFRFNTYLGMAVVLSAMGEAGVTEFGVIISLVIPFINVLAVSTLIWYSSEDYSTAQKVRILFRELLANPLILACLAGLVYAGFETPFPVFFENTFRLLSVAALPLALLSIGNSLTFGQLKHYFKPALVAAFIKLFMMPVLGYVVLTWVGVTGLAFKVSMVYFALPTATSAFILSSQMNSDTKLASACIVLSTLLSFVSLSMVLNLG